MEYAVSVTNGLHPVFKQSHSNLFNELLYVYSKISQMWCPPGNNSRTLTFSIILINDLPNCLYFSQPRMYADDTSLTFASVDLKHIDDCLNYDLNRVYTWLSANKLTLNLTKTEFMLVASRQKLSTFPEIPQFQYK